VLVISFSNFNHFPRFLFFIFFIFFLFFFFDILMAHALAAVLLFMGIVQGSFPAVNALRYFFISLETIVAAVSGIGLIFFGTTFTPMGLDLFWLFFIVIVWWSKQSLTA
jgi:hypothetical protein